MEISELIHDNVVIDQTKIASSGTWASTKCFMKESTDALSNRKDVCDGNKLKSKKKKAAPKNITPKTQMPAKPPAAQDIPVAETPQLEIDEFEDESSEMIADGPGPNNDAPEHENIGEEYYADADSIEELVEETV